MGFQNDSVWSNVVSQLSSNQHLLAVSKLQPIEKIRHLHSLGQIDFGENYIQEALEKIDLLRDLNIRWHMIGPIQKNKVKFLKKNFEYIHSVDSIDLAKKISEKALEINYQQKIFCQINLSEESTKYGFHKSNFLDLWTDLNQLKGLKIVGLMTMPPLENQAIENKKYFSELKSIAQNLDLSELSMGTSHDYQVALTEGATWIRIGTTLFGERQKKEVTRG